MTHRPISAAPLPWATVLAATVLIAVTTGIRQSLGLFVRPLAATGIGIATVSLALAVGQFFWGVAQPLAGVLADRIGAHRVIVIGAVLLAAGLALTPALAERGGVFLTLGVVSALGTGAASFAILIGSVSRRVPRAHQSLASAVINSGASLGQFVMAPLSQALISAAGWASAMYALATAGGLTMLLAIPAAGRSDSVGAEPGSGALREMLRTAFADRSYWCLHASFFACGFHIAFLSTHLPNEIALCGLAASAAATALAIIGILNVAGSLAFGALARRYRQKSLLAFLYAARVAAVLLYVAAPKTLITLYAFSAVLGLTWLATVPSTAGLIAKLFGARHLATLFGMTMLTHQIGAFFGAWLGGLFMARTGSYQAVWLIDAGLATLAAIANLPIREAAIPRVVATPA